MAPFAAQDTKSPTLVDNQIGRMALEPPLSILGNVHSGNPKPKVPISSALKTRPPSKRKIRWCYIQNREQTGRLMLLALWQNIQSRLDSRLKGWRNRVDDFGQIAAVKRRSDGLPWTDNETFEALLKAVLSNNTGWSRIEQIPEDDLKDLFCEFSLHSYAELPQCEIGERIVPWFSERKAGSRTLKRDLENLRLCARRLSEYSRTEGLAESYFTLLVRRLDGDPKLAVLELGLQGELKLPGFGVAVAAEALKNLGFDVAKPDRHVKRAVGCFGLVPFERWRNRVGRTSPPQRSKATYLAVMGAVRDIAVSADVPVVEADNAIWLLGARSGLSLTNAELAEIAHKAKDPNVLADAVGALIRSWSETQDVAEQRETFNILVTNLDRERQSMRKLFPSELKGTSW